MNRHTIPLGRILGIPISLDYSWFLIFALITWTMAVGITALLISGIGGILGGYLMYFATGRKYNPVIGIAGVSCVPTTAKVAQKEAREANKTTMILPYAMGANISGVITSAILAGIYVTLLR